MSRGYRLTDRTDTYLGGLHRLLTLMRERQEVGTNINELASWAGLKPDTVSKALNRTGPVFKLVLEKLFHALDDALQPEDYEPFPVKERKPKKEKPQSTTLPKGVVTTLPRQLTSFVGRGKEIEAVKRLLTSSPLVTLTGTGGCGKTRLALQVAAEVLEQYSHGVLLVELAALADPALVPQAVATALKLREEPGRILTQTVNDYLRSKSMLLILDNCEHLLPDCADLTDTLLKSCPHVRILATSQVVLRLTGEQIYRVPSLAAPDPDHLPTDEKAMTAFVSECEAARLFVERASLQIPGFMLTPQNASAVALVCHHLDGIPLAIELAAARVRAMLVEQIAARLDDRFRLLTGGNHGALPRQQTLQALIDWSYSLLTEEERLLLHRLSVFRGGWTLEAAEAVCLGEGIEDWQILDLLTSLVDKSLVVYEGREEKARYRLLETIRQYAEGRLEASGARPRFRSAHREYFLHLAEEANQKLSGPEQGKSLQQLETEHDNLRAALDYCAEEAGGAKVRLRMSAALARFWWIRGYLSEGRKHLEDALASEEAGERTAERARALNGAGVLAFMQGENAIARSHYDQSLSIRREIDDRRGIFITLGNLILLARQQGDFAEAQAFLNESLAISKESMNQSDIARAYSHQALLAYDQGDYGRAYLYHKKSLDKWREIGDRSNIAYTLCNMGNVAFRQGEKDIARSHYEESLTIRREIGDLEGIAYSLNGLADVLRSQEDQMAARSAYDESLSIFQKIGDRRGIATILRNLGQISKDTGDNAKAEQLYKESLSLYDEIGDKRNVAATLEAVADLAAAQRLLERAARLIGAAKALRERIGSPLSPTKSTLYDQLETQARNALGEAAFAAAWALGQAMTMEKAIEYVLEER